MRSAREPSRRRYGSVYRILRGLILFAAWFSGIVVLLSITVSPIVEQRIPYDSELAIWLEWSRFRVMEWMVVFWFFAFGAMVGSFVNVVVWRMPRGESISASGSACPYCRQKILLRDNIPVYGWFKLGGRCRVCRLPISSRYPLIELLFGLVFLVLFLVELQSSGGNLPGGARYPQSGIIDVIRQTRWDIILITTYHALLLTMLMTWSLMAFDKSRIPVKTVVFAFAIGILVPVLFSCVYPVSWFPFEAAWSFHLSLGNRLLTGVTGLVVGWLVGKGIQRCENLPASTFNPTGLTLCFALIGLCLGWQAAAWVLFLFGIGGGIQRMITDSDRLPSAAILTGATFLFLCTWVLFETDRPLARPQQTLISLVAGAVLIAIANQIPSRKNMM